ncbi:PadR family transcriptional regulator [Actinoplanes sp. NPDC051851]|uniref:PadR family transcriptional regulator n=1 Tax=Actinoplanes sp. NPDC051851 TaxID=3154753 RepID=UPI0034292122
MPQDASQNSLVLPILGLLGESPVHAYDLATRVRERCPHLDPTRSTVATLLKSMARAGLVTPNEPEQVGNRPPRTEYELTEAGRVRYREKVEAGLRDSPAGSVDFVVALTHLAAIDSGRAAELLRARMRRLEEDYAVLSDTSRPPAPEASYWRGILSAEIAWVATLVEHDLAKQ